MSRAFKKVLISVLSVLFSVIAFGGATVAWLSVSNMAAVDGFELYITTSGTIEVSVDGTNFYTTVSTEDLMASIGDKVKLADITSPDGINFYTDRNQIGKIREPNENYISFDLWLRSRTQSNEYLFLTDNSSNEITYESLQTEPNYGTYIVSKGVSWEADASFDNGEKDIIAGDSDIYYASKAVRISVNEQPIEEEYLGKVDERTGLSTFLFDPSEDETRGYGKEYGSLAYYNAKTLLFKLTTPKIVPNTKYELTTFKNPYEANDLKSMVATFQQSDIVNPVDGIKYKYVKIEVNIWLEGWDADCFNAIYADLVLIQLKFQGAKLITNMLISNNN